MYGESGFLYNFLSIVDIDNTTQIHDIYTISNLFNHRNVYINQPQNLIMTELLIPYECRALLGCSSLSFPGQQTVSSSCVNQRPHTECLLRTPESFRSIDSLTELKTIYQQKFTT